MISSKCKTSKSKSPKRRTASGTSRIKWNRFTVNDIVYHQLKISQTITLTVYNSTFNYKNWAWVVRDDRSNIAHNYNLSFKAAKKQVMVWFIFDFAKRLMRG